MTLIFDPLNHRYYVDGLPVPGLHEILKAVGLIWEDWFLPEKTLRGRYVHKAIDLLNKGVLDWNTVKNPILGYVRAYQKAQDELKFQVLSSELFLYAPKYGFCCTIDWLVEFDGVLCLLEGKSGQFQKIHALQVGAQKLALAENGHHISKKHVLKLNENGTYRLEPIDFRAEFDWLTVLSFYNLKLNYRG